MRSFGTPFSEIVHHVGGTQFAEGAEYRKPVEHSCGYEGFARHWETAGWLSYDCEGCGEVVVLWDDGALPQDVDDGDVPHVDPDRLDGPPERFGPREVA